MKKLFTALVILPLMAWAGKTFEVDFNDFGVVPGIAKGSKTPYRFKDFDLQLRMFPGVKGSGNSLNIANSECVEFIMKNNFDPRRGTVSMWISPVNWQVYDKSWQPFFFAWQNDFALRIHKRSPGYIEATIDHRPKKGKREVVTVCARVDAKDWAPGRWHKLDVTWDETRISLYIDGRIPAPTPTRIGTNTQVRPTNPVRSFKVPQVLPEASGRFCIGTRFDWQTRKEVVRTDKTAFDSVTVYNRILNAEEIRKGYEEVFPTVLKMSMSNYAVVPLQKGNVPDWSKATKLYITNPIKAGPYVNSYVLAAHDSKNLYLKYFVGKPAVKTTCTKHDDNLWEDDSVEFRFAAGSIAHDVHFIVNSKGVIFDRRNLDARWNSKAVAVPEAGKNHWGVTLTIPIADLGGAAVIGQESKAEFCYNWPDGMDAHLYHWGNYKSKVYGVKDGFKLGTDDSYFRLEANMQEMISGNLNISGAGKLNGKTVSTKILPAGYEEVSYPGDFNGKSWQRALPAGLVTVVVESPVYRFYRTTTVDFPLEVRHNNNPATRQLKLEIDLTNAGAAVAEKVAKQPIPGVAKLIDPAGKVVAQLKFEQKQIKNVIKLKLPDKLVAGTYTIDVVTSGKGTTLNRKVPFRVPDLEPFTARVGDDHTVPDPWKPLVSIGKDAYKTITGTYQVGPGAFPSKITNGDTQLFLAPPVWQINGKEIKWSGLKKVASYDDFVRYQGVGKTDALELKWQGELWFDGAWILKFELNPVKGKAAIKDFSISYKVPAVAGKFAMDPIYVPFKDNKVAIALGGDARRKDNVLWLSGHKKGVFFWVRSNANWANKPNENPLTAEKKKDYTQALLKVISRPVTLNKKAEYTMVIMGTPSRVPMKEFRLANYNGYLRNSHNRYQPINFLFRRNEYTESDMVSSTSCTPADPEGLRRYAAEYVKRGIKLHIYTMPGQISSAEPDYDYLGKDNWSSPRVNHAGTKLGKPWIQDYFCFNATDMTSDIWCYDIDKTMKNNPIDGLYYDVAASKFCENPAHGCGGKDVFGQHFVSSDALGFRTFLMRNYKTMHKNNGSCLLHSHVQFLPMAHGFIDMFAPGENTFHTMAVNLDYGYCEGISLEQYQTDFNWQKAGVPYCHIIQSGRVCRFAPGFQKFRAKVENSPEYALRALAPVIVHDFNTWPTFVYNRTVNNWWGLRKEIGLGNDKEVEFVGYWENKAAVPKAEKTLCSYYKFNQKGVPYKYLLMISNFNRTPVKAQMDIDFAALGIKKPETVTNVWHNKQIAGKGVRNKEIKLSQLNKITIPGNHFLLIGIK